MALALLMAGITTASVKIFGWKWHPTAPTAVASSARRGASRDLSHDQRLVAVKPEPEPEPSDAPVSPSASGNERHLSASEMFAEAAEARTAGNAPQAIRLSEQIEEFFPNSEAGIKTHLALGVLYLQQNRAELALQEFATFRRVGSPEAKAEAYFGQAQALRKLSRFEDERIVLGELLQSYPRSAYVAAARIRLAELTTDAPVQ